MCENVVRSVEEDAGEDEEMKLFDAGRRGRLYTCFPPRLSTSISNTLLHLFHLLPSSPVVLGRLYVGRGHIAISFALHHEWVR